VTLQGVRADIFWPQTREEANQFSGVSSAWYGVSVIHQN
jgi:hypothetical protein